MILKKIVKYLNRPHVLIYLIAWRVLLTLRYYILLVKTKLKGISLEFDRNILFYQKTIITGKGTVKIGKNTTFGVANGGGYRYNMIEIQPRTKTSNIIIGDNVAINNSAFICSSNRIEIKDNVLIGRNLSLADFEAHGTLPDKRREVGAIGEVIIGENVWIGNNVTILKNVYIGENSIVASGSVVLKGNYPSNCIIGGNPAKVVKKII